MIACLLMGFVGYKTVAWLEEPSEITTTENSSVQLNRLYEAVKNGSSRSWFEKTGDDILIPNTNWWVKKQDDRRVITPTRSNQRENTADWWTNKNYEIWIGYTIRHWWYNIDSPVQDYVQAAYDMWWMDRVIVGQCEQHREPAVKSLRENSYWMFQIYWPDHPEIINNPKFQTDWKREMEQAYILYKNWTPFYGPGRISKVTWNPCYVDAQKRFTLANQN